MSKKMKRITLFTALLVLLISIPSTLAYFSAYKTSTSSHALKLGESSTIIENKVESGEKQLVITADEDSGPIFVRAKAFAPEGVTLSYEGENWSAGEESFYYYSEVIQKGESTSTLYVKMTDLPEEGEEFHVVVVYEATPAVYENGNWTCDWSVTVGGGN